MQRTHSYSRGSSTVLSDPTNLFTEAPLSVFDLYVWTVHTQAAGQRLLLCLQANRWCGSLTDLLGKREVHDGPDHFAAAAQKRHTAEGVCACARVRETSVCVHSVCVCVF